MSDTPLSLLDRLARQNAADDWAALVAIYRPLLTAWVRPHVPQSTDADDVVQETLTVVVQKLPEFRHNGSAGAFRAWLRAILVHKLLQLRRVRGQNPETIDTGDGLTLSQLEQPDSEAARRWDAEHDRHVLGRLLDRLRGEFTPVTWEAFRLYALEGQAPAAVAAGLGITTNAVFIARSRILKRLREEARGLVPVEP